jgi:uncharacterized protein YkwD
MNLRALSTALLAGVLLVGVGGTPAFASGSSDTMQLQASETFKGSEAKRAKRAARVAAATALASGRTAVPDPTTVSTYADRVLARTNVERTSRGLRPLSFSACADGFADSWAAQLAQAGSLSHQSLSPILDRCRARSVGENVAYGNVTPEALVQMWMNSAGHRANILNPGFTHLGVGDVTTATGRVYGVQVFLAL